MILAILIFGMTLSTQTQAQIVNLVATENSGTYNKFATGMAIQQVINEILLFGSRQSIDGIKFSGSSKLVSVSGDDNDFTETYIVKVAIQAEGSTQPLLVSVDIVLKDIGSVFPYIVSVSESGADYLSL